MNKPKGLSENIRQSALDVGADYAEVVLDQWLKNGILRELPAIRTVIGVGRGVLSMRDSLFLKKIKLFVESIDERTQDERETFAGELDAKPKYRDRVLDAILLIIDQLDDTEKAVLLARAFSAFVTKEIESFYYFRRYAEIIKGANVVHLRNFYQSVQNDGDITTPRTFIADQVLPLISLGLVEFSEPSSHFGQRTPSKKGLTWHVPTKFGCKFVQTVIRKEDIETANGDDDEAQPV